MDSLAFLEKISKSKLQPIYVLHGDQDFLKRLVLEALRKRVFGEEEAFGLSTYPGDKATLVAVRQDLETLPFLSPQRLVVVEKGDPFVTRYREALEKYVDQPAATGILVLDVTSWPATTKLAKKLDANATIVCKAPAEKQLPEWCVQWMSSRHEKQLGAPAARLLVDLVGADMGLLAQELAKLAAYAGSNAKLDATDVDKVVGSSRMENTWKIFDAIGAARTSEALTILDRLFDQGEDPIRLLGAFSLQMRRLAQAYRLTRLGKPLAVALTEAGIPPFAVRAAEQQLKHLGVRRAERLYEWLVEADLGLKGSSELPPRALFERFVVKLSMPREE